MASYSAYGSVRLTPAPAEVFACSIRLLIALEAVHRTDLKHKQVVRPAQQQGAEERQRSRNTFLALIASFTVLGLLKNSGAGCFLNCMTSHTTLHPVWSLHASWTIRATAGFIVVFSSDAD